MVIRGLAVWLAGFVFFMFLGLYLQDGVMAIYEGKPAVRLAELIVFSGILGLTIREFVLHYKRTIRRK